MDNHLYSYLDVFNSLNFEGFKDHPNILIAANFWEEDRYNAAKVCYKYMRMIDDLIDNYKADHKEIQGTERTRFLSEVSQWINPVRNKYSSNPLFKELIETVDRYHIPVWIMEAFAKSMTYDIHHNGFASLHDFKKYTEGASVAPASIFVHLCGLIRQDGVFKPPQFDVKKAAYPCATFSYLVHIIRDFQKDQHNNLNYFADDLLVKYKLSKEDLKEISEGGKIKEGFRLLVKEYHSMADAYRLETFQVIREISPFIEKRYFLSLLIIFNLYLMVFERINVREGRFTTEELNPTSDEIRERVYKTITEFGK